MAIFPETKVLLKNENAEICCEVLSVEDDRLKLSYPEEYIHLCKFFEEGEYFTATIYSQDGILTLECIVLNSPLEGDFEIDFTEEEASVKFIQRRNYLRSNCNFHMQIFYDDKMVEATTLDLGGGGIRFISEEDCSLVKNVYVAVVIEADFKIHIRGEILKKGISKSGKQEYLLLFADKIESKQMDKIIKVCNQVDAQKLRKLYS